MGKLWIPEEIDITDYRTMRKWYEEVVALLGEGYWTLSGSNIYRSTGYVGIGHTSPGCLLDINKSVAGYSLSVKNGIGSGAHYNAYLRCNSVTGGEIQLKHNYTGTYTGEQLQIVNYKTATSGYKFIALYSGDGGDLETNLRGDGINSCDGSWNGGGAGIGHIFNNLDESKNIPFGTTVVIESGKCREATALDSTNIYGVACHQSKPSFICIPGWNKWVGKYERNPLGHYDLDDKGYRKLSDKFDKDKDYVPRDKRPKEHTVVEYSGLIRVLNDQPVNPNWFFQQHIDENVDEYLI